MAIPANLPLRQIRDHALRADQIPCCWQVRYPALEHEILPLGQVRYPALGQVRDPALRPDQRTCP